MYVYVELFCPPTFDGWSCWNATAAGRISVAPCPYFITGFDPKSNMRRQYCTTTLPVWLLISLRAVYFRRRS